MPTLNQKPGSITKEQIRKLNVAARRCGLDLEALRESCGTDSIRTLSAADASMHIRRLSREDLPNPPGKAPNKRRRATPGILTMIDAPLIEQIERLGMQFFGDDDKFRSWLEKNFKCRDARQLASARRAGEVINVLKRMLDRSSTRSSEAHS